MATVRELQASFVAKANGLKSTIQGIKKDIDGLQTKSKDVSSKMNSNFINIGKSLTKFGDNMQKVSKKAKSLGSDLTKKITLPAAGAATAIGGLTAALGWKRLVGLDTAQAQLKGLGYTTKEVERISEQVTTAIDGGMTTMAEGTAVAAGALAAGVKEGAELERYIKLVGDAAVGANRPVGDMAMIFNRVQGMGKLMTQELNMIEDGMPGFSAAMAESFNVTQGEFREMVTAGEVDSKQFLNVMETFAGGTAAAYSESWEGMVANTKAYIGIIGENLLGGVFEKSKESISEFIDFLKSDEVVAWAKKVGKAIGDVFGSVVDTVKSAIQWFANLSNSQQEVIMKFGAIAIAAGPLILTLATVGGIIGKLSSGLGTLLKPISKAGGLLKLLKAGFTALTGPVGLTIAIIAALATAFTIAYKKSETFRNIVNKVLDSVKDGFQKLKEKVSEVLSVVVDYFKDKIAELKSFWDSEGQLFLQAVSNVFDGIWKVVKPVIDAIVSVVKKSLPIVQSVFSTVFKVILEIVKSVWGNIKGVIDGGLKVIMGLIKVFSGLFTGDFSKMWEGIKDLFKGAIQFIWNFVQLMFWGKLLKGVIGFVKGFSSPISAMWTSIKDLFSRVINWIVEFVKNSFTKMKDAIAKISSGIQKGLDTAWNFILNIIKKVVQAIVDFVKSRFTTLKNNVTTIFNAVKKFITNVWNAIYSFFKTIIKSIVDFVKSRFNNLKTNITNIFNSIKNTVKSIWNGIKDNIINPITNAVKTGLNKFGEFKRKVTDTFKNIKNSVSDYVSDMVQKVKDMPGKMKDGIVKGAGKVYDGMKSLANKMVEGLGKGVNGVITGVNWVLGKLGVKEKSRLSKWKVPKYAKGTDGHPEDGPALINDGKGNNAGQELIVEPDGTMGMYEGKNVLAYLKKGTQVIPAKLTKEMIPKYAKGTGSIVKSVKKGAKKVAEWTGNIWDHIKNPSKLLDIALKTVGISTPDASDLVGKIAKGGFNFVKDKAVGFIKDKMENLFGGGDIPNVTGSGVQRWEGVARQALMMTNQYTEANLKRLLYQMKTESGGNPKAINLWDINAKRGIPSKGLMQVIDPTFQAYKMPGFNNIWNPLDNILASIRYAVSRYGSLARAYRGVGYADGGIVDTKQLAWIAEGGWAESIISHDPSKRVRQQRIWQETGDRLGFTDDKYSKQMLAELERIARSVEAGQRNITKAIENKPVLSGSDIKQEYDRRDSKEAINHSIFTGRPRR
ncbi:tape measure protein [Oceanobacillus caeni]|uniref:tape measure protein n=1 Tax=Oceanobacillus caeni TaxID=405946 RepID=UPI002149D092|nr:tape measure protein [Oceanobacillus caeni]MCR1833052.1 tape measure protein [Oceanobacillus caeni]